jgi:hypothetical protein
MEWTYVGLSCIEHPSFFALKFRRDHIWSDRTSTISFVCCPSRGTMQLHIPRSMKAEVIIAFVVICTHEEYVEPVIDMLILWISSL